jgi:hypothetical protein
VRKFKIVFTDGGYAIISAYSIQHALDLADGGDVYHYKVKSVEVLG